MGYITRPFRCKCRFFKDSDREDWMYWYFAPEGAALYPHYHRFNNPFFMDGATPWARWSHVGPRPGLPQYFNGENAWKYRGKAGCQVGTQQEFVEGLSVGQLGPFTRPECCRWPEMVCGGDMPTSVKGYLTCTAPAGCLTFWNHYLYLFFDPDQNAWLGGGVMNTGGQYVNLRWEVAPHAVIPDRVVSTLTADFYGVCDYQCVTVSEFDCPFTSVYHPRFNGSSWRLSCGCTGGTALEGPVYFDIVITPYVPEWDCVGGILITNVPRNMPTVSGGIKLTGSAKVGGQFEWLCTGNITLSGDATCTVPLDVTASGNVRIVGSAVAVPPIPSWVSSGGVVVGGIVDLAIPAPLPTGGFILTGTSTVSPVYHAYCYGGLVLSGTADATFQPGPAGTGVVSETGDYLTTESGVWIITE